MRHVGFVFLISMAALLVSCGGDDNGVFVGIGNPGGGGMNTLAVTVDPGPAAAAGAVNTLYTTVTICAPGSTTECQTIDHVQVDTGSTGSRAMAPVVRSRSACSSRTVTVGAPSGRRISISAAKSPTAPPFRSSATRPLRLSRHHASWARRKTRFKPLAPTRFSASVIS